MRPEANKAMIFDLLDALLRSWWTVVAGVSLGLAAAVVLLYNTPKTYEAKAKILITPQQTKLIKTQLTGDPTRELMALEEAVISDAYMTQLIERTFGLPETDEELNRRIRTIRSRLTIRPTATLHNGWLAFDLIFRSRNPEHAAALVNSIGEVYIEQNRDGRISDAGATATALQARVDESKAHFEEIDAELQAFLTEHSFETESHLDANLRLLENAQRDMDFNTNSQTLARESLVKLGEQREALIEGKDNSVDRLTELQNELEKLLVSYSEAHPTVVRKRREIEELRASVKRDIEAGVPETPVPLDPAVQDIDDQIVRIEQELTTLGNDARRLRRQISEYERRIQAVATVQPQLNKLRTQHRIILDRYRSHQEDLDTARETQFLEESDQAAQLELAERANPPRSPVYPVPERFYALGVMGGLLLFVGPLLALRFFSPPVSSEAALKALTDVPVLVSIPRIETPALRGHVYKRLALNFGLATVSASALVAVIIFFH